MHKGTNQVSCVFSGGIAHINDSNLSPFFSLSFKEACPDMSPSLLSLFNPFLRHLLSIQWPQRVTWPRGWRSSNLLHPIGYRDMDMTTHQLPRSGLGRPLLVWYTVFCLYKHKLKGNLQWHPKLWTKKPWMAITFIHMKRSMQIWLSHCVHKAFYL